MTNEIAIVGMACCYPDAHSPAELWENVLAQRRSFRRMPPERLNLADYWSNDPTVPDRTYGSEAALIKGYEFDRVAFRIMGSTFRSADLVHWVALDIANRALTNAGFPHAEGLPRESTGILLGNTLTGEFSRANSLRLRWPYVRRVIESVLEQADYSSKQNLALLQILEQTYKAPFPDISEETLAGNLSNTIAGRICNYFDFKGGGYSVDGACSSSLLAVAQACTGLLAGDLDVALVGGVDLSLDPFELVGFAKAGALATDEMRVYDARSAGFWPGEGCGFVVLMRYEDAIAQNCSIYAVIRGWGVSSDGNGGITRPEVEGQILALERAYRRAGFGIDTVSYFEGHGTGTHVGDETELSTLSRARHESNPNAPAAVIGSLKANIGHTKAAAGIAGLIKATLALHHQLLPPHPMCEQPHALLTTEDAALRVLPQGQLWPQTAPLRAGVSAMGFGGINAHIVLESSDGNRRQSLNQTEKNLLHSVQKTELFLFQTEQLEQLQQQVNQILEIAPRLSRAELTDLAAHLAQSLHLGNLRAAIVAATPMELTTQLKTLATWLAEGITDRLDLDAGIFIGQKATPPNIGFLFPGQASPTYFNGGCWEYRFDDIRELYSHTFLPDRGEGNATAIAQPAIVTASKAGMIVLEQLGITAQVAIGHSLGEITALHWAGAFDQTTLLRIAQVRGQAMTDLGSTPGAMASIQASQQAVQLLINRYPVVIAGLNSPQQTIISGEVEAINELVSQAQKWGLKAVALAVSHAFHSDLVAAAAEPLAEHLATETIQPLQRKLVSTITGTPLTAKTDIRSLLHQQVTAPVRFLEAITQANQEVDLWIEVGPGQVLTRLAQDCGETPAISIDAGGPSLRGLLQSVGATFALGSAIEPTRLFCDRFTRPFDLDWQPNFFVNPCELAPQSKMQEVSSKKNHSNQAPISKTAEISYLEKKIDRQSLGTYQPIEQFARPSANQVITKQDEVVSPLEMVRQLVAQRTELPTTAIQDHHRLLSDLHLNSITVGQLVAEAAKALELEPSAAPTNYADATVAEIAQALDDLVQTGGATAINSVNHHPPGIEAWVRTFTVEWRDCPLSSKLQVSDIKGVWQILTPCHTPFSETLQQSFQTFPGQGVVVYLATAEDAQTIDCLLSGAQQILAEDQYTHFVLVQQAPIGGGVARTLHLEHPQITTCVVTLPTDHPQSVPWILAEVQAAKGYTEVRYDQQGNRQIPILKLQQCPETSLEVPLTATDVLLVTGGGKGIAAECALALARETGVRLALLGRSHLEVDSELYRNLERIRANGIEMLYEAADVTDLQAVQKAIQKFETQLGPITAVLHGAGVNTPQLLTTLTPADFHKTLAPKVHGLNNLLLTANPKHLKFLITFGSLIARTGLRGEADYALANEWLANLMEDFQQANPSCRCLNLEWSIWSGVGMGERLGRVDALLREGITPIVPDMGISILRQLMAQSPMTTSVIITGRFGQAPTLRMEKTELPFLRFLEHPRVYYPGIELVIDANLSIGTDPYLNDHVYQGERIFPAVMGLEAMAQVATALAGESTSLVFEDVQFNRPVVIPANDTLTIRIAALVTAPGYIKVALRSDQTAFGINHFEATCHTLQVSNSKDKIKIPASSLSLNPEQDLYGSILFQSGRFQRLQGYRLLRATKCIAELSPNQTASWFNQYFSNRLILGDPGTRDAIIHSLQACIPQRTLLPVAVERIIIVPTRITEASSDTIFVSAQERERQNERFTYDLTVVDSEGNVLEEWQGLQLQAMPQTSPLKENKVWPVSLLGPYLERQLQTLIPSVNINVMVEYSQSLGRRERRDLALQQITPLSLLTYRPNGKPELISNGASSSISVAHSDSLTLVVFGKTTLGCDIETVVHRELHLWQDLLGKERFNLAQLLANETNENLNVAATRIWTALECLKKAAISVRSPLVMLEPADDTWVLLQAGSLVIATYRTSIAETVTQTVLPKDQIFSILLEKEDSQEHNPVKQTA
ncbi:type I polyketide synthase [Leptothoe spongobia]|uniref:SDR family NAD(P)-dependent oxidoreductase n=1 Tax=Leptothoe spongobia TAU-MAC 1115 TaxID=1967444 RepID=A0A947DD17_9CYAN|nr:type I polyketide synthase [Leptothoe spongobia]MBT9314702.1 SDR family NAD(P)-dependent oxidoreductase [Leptothoe spongobia TAU-MAC 1115]